VEDQLVLVLAGAEAVAPDLVGTPGLVGGRVVERGGVAVPGGAAVDVGELVVEQFAGGEVLDAYGVALVAGDVGRVGEQGGARAHAGAAEAEEVVALGECVEVEQHLLAGERGLVVGDVGGCRRGPVVGVGGLHPAARAVLLPLEAAAVVPVAARARRDAQIGLESARLDLLEDLRAQVGEVVGLCLGVGVLGLDVGDDLGVLLLPEPLVVIGPGQAVELLGRGLFGGDRPGRRGEGGRHERDPIPATLEALSTGPTRGVHHSALSHTVVVRRDTAPDRRDSGIELGGAGVRTR
jgi:hypothetical protein